MKKKVLKYYFLFFLFLSFGVPTFAQQQISFSKDIAPLIFQKCTPCHRPNQIGPMPLTTYEEVASYATMIDYVTKVGYMPPWRATSTAHAFKGQNTLSETELQLLQQWIANGFPEGDPKETPPLPLFANAEKMKHPDLTLSMSEAFEQYGVYYDQYRVFVLPTGLQEDQMVSSIEFVPGKSSIVRGAVFSITTGEETEVLEEWDPQYGYFSFGEIGFLPEESHWYNWHPGKEITTYSQGEGLYLPKNSKIVLHLHYGPTGVPEKDSSILNLQFSKEKTTTQVFSIPLLHPYNMTNDTFFLPAEKTTRYHASFTAPFDLEILGLFPHSHLLGKQWEIFTSNADRSPSQSLLKISDWDFNWKQMYEFEYPVIVPKGTTIHTLTSYDNTSKNLLNPSDPPRSMSWGKRMFEEMFVVHFKMSTRSNTLPNKQTFRILPQSVIFSKDTPLVVKFQSDKRQNLTGLIKDFSGQVQSVVFKNKRFRKGVFNFPVDLNHLAYGNYYLEIESSQQVERKLFVLMEKDLFD